MLLIAIQIPCLALCRACEADISSEVNLGTVIECDSSHLRSEFQRLDLSIHSPKGPDLENGPPSKRRKLHEEGPEFFERIIGDLDSMLGGPQTVE
jgi:serine/threonine-protein kinase ATR